jgi:hypothetical protein
MAVLFVICWKKYAKGNLYNESYVVQEGVGHDFMEYDDAQAQVNVLNSAPSSTVYYISTEEAFYADMPPLVPYDVKMWG